MSSHNEGERAYQVLLERYADGQKLCNCRTAYRTECPGGGICGLCGPKTPHHDYCKGGCGTAVIRAREHVALGVTKELAEPTSAGCPHPNASLGDWMAWWGAN